MPDNKPQSQQEQWCHRAETTNLLALSVAQIHMSLTEGDNSIDTLTESFQKLANFCSKVENLAKEDTVEQGNHEIIELAESMSSQVNDAIVAFQFYDRLCQRLQHVTTSLNGLGDLLQDDAHLKHPDGWQQLREQIRQQYTMQAEHQMFELIMQGYTPEQALEQYKASLLVNHNQDDIELF